MKNNTSEKQVIIESKDLKAEISLQDFTKKKDFDFLSEQARQVEQKVWQNFRDEISGKAPPPPPPPPPRFIRDGEGPFIPRPVWLLAPVMCVLFGIALGVIVKKLNFFIF